MTTYRWRIDFFLPGLPLARPVQLGTIQLQPAPPDDRGHSQCRGYLRLDLDDYADDGVVESLAILRLESVAIAAAALGGSVREPVIQSIRLANRGELDAAGIRTPISGSLTVSFNMIAPTIDERELLDGYRAVLSVAPHQLPLWRRAARWLWKANSEADPYDQMLALWISFNVLYGPHIRRGEQQGIEDYVTQTITKDSAALLMNSMITSEDLRCLENSGPPLRNGWRIADELRSARGKPVADQDPVELVKLTLLSVYAIRCTIVHEGAVAARKDEEVRLVWASAHALKAVIMHVLRTLLGVQLI